MAFFPKLGLFLFILLHAIFVPSHSNDEEDTLLKGLNGYRSSLNLSSFIKNPQAKCIAKQIANTRDNEPCPFLGDLIPAPTLVSELSKEYRNKCKLNLNTTREAVLMPVCVKNLVPSLVLGNFTKNELFILLLNDSKYTGAGAASEDDWMVVALSTSKPSGALLVNGAYRVLKVGLMLVGSLLAVSSNMGIL